MEGVTHKLINIFKPLNFINVGQTYFHTPTEVVVDYFDVVGALSP